MTDFSSLLHNTQLHGRQNEAIARMIGKKSSILGFQAGAG